MLKATIIIILTLLAHGAQSTGTASQYAPGVMQATAAYHGYEYGDGRFVAVADCSRIGDYVLLRQPGGEWEIHRVADCAGNDGTPGWMAANSIIVEISYETAVRWDTVGSGLIIDCVGCGD